MIQLVGRDEVKEAKGDILRLLAVPKPHPGFEFYTLIFSPEEGLLKIIVYGKDIRTNGFGESVRDAFVDIRNAISRIYGQPAFTLDYVKDGSIWKEPEDWMMGLLKEERTLVSTWQKGLPNRIYAVALEATALSQEKGFLKVIYEFEGWNEYAAEMKNKEGAVF